VAREGQIVSQPQDLLKEPLVLEFLDLSEQARYSESDPEAAIIGQLERFLLERGKGSRFQTWGTMSTMPSRRSVAGEPSFPERARAYNRTTDANGPRNAALLHAAAD